MVLIVKTLVSSKGDGSNFGQKRERLEGEMSERGSGWGFVW